MIKHEQTPLVLTKELIDFCTRWKIVKLELFGSVLRGDARPDSDIDLLVTFAPDSRWNLMDLVTMEWELGDLLGRKADLVVRRAIEQSSNPYRKQEILGTARVLYAA